MKFFVVTNRERKAGHGFSNEPERHGKVHFLQKELASLPKSDRDLKLDYIGSSDSREKTRVFVEAVREELLDRKGQLERKKVDRKPSLVLYAHGYNNDYGDSLEEYVELRRQFHRAIGKQEFESQCLLVLFTWPSAGRVTAYLEDRDDARASYPAVSNLVHLLFRETHNLEKCISNVCVIAHSMGNYVFRESLAALVGSSKAPAGTFINQFASIGADIGNTSLEPGGKGFGLTRFSDRITVYFSPADSTLSKSRRKNGRSRLGRTLSQDYETTPANVVFVDCRAWANESTLDELFPKGAPSVHSCYRSVPAILKDLFEVLRGTDREMIPGRSSLQLNKLYHLDR